MSLFDESFDINLTKPKAKDLIKKISENSSEEEISKALKSKTLPLKERLLVIKNNVLRILGKQRDNTIVIRTRDEFDKYIEKAIEVGRIAIDTETLNSLDPITTDLAGLCLYVPGEKQAYIPVNHIDIDTNERLQPQMTDDDCREELQKIIDNNVFTVFHNYKFDYQVIKCACKIEVPCSWDTMICARLLDENERAGLKQQYITKIDPSQSKYDIEGLFENVLYAQVDPEIFALYAATDSMMTDKLYLWQRQFMESEEFKNLCWLYKNIELPIALVTAEMELTGVDVDQGYGAKLKKKYDEKLFQIDTRINEELIRLKPIIDKWKLSPEANQKTKTYVPAKTKMTKDKIEAMYTLVDKDGNRYKVGKAKAEQLSDPINLASPVQLAILFYDIFGCKAVSKKSPRGTGEEEMQLLAKSLKIKVDEDELDEISLEDDGDAITVEQANNAASTLCGLIVERRGIMKLLTTYIETIPTLVKHWPDGRIRFHLNSLGTDTGRYSSGGKIGYLEGDKRVEVSGINIQNIPSHAADIRPLFAGSVLYNEIENTEDFFEVNEYEEVETVDGWKYPNSLTTSDIIKTSDENYCIKSIVADNSNKVIKYKLFI